MKPARATLWPSSLSTSEKTVLVVGDHEQVSPSAVGQDLGIIQNLIFQYLPGIPNADLYDGQISIYDLARQSFGGTTCLVEHSVVSRKLFSSALDFLRLPHQAFA